MDYTGRHFGRLTALELIERDYVWNDHRWKFACECGNEVVLRIKSVRGGNTSSCGCLQKEILVRRNTKHGLCRQHPRTYRSWKDMRARCRNPKHKDFKYYGERGVTICKEWEDFAVFFADMGIRPEGMTIDRIETNGNYESSNCRWATDLQQANNKRNNRRLTINGEVKTLQEWCRNSKLEHSKVRYRLSQGYGVEKSFSSGDFRRVG
jgi:hypothetical protein